LFFGCYLIVGQALQLIHVFESREINVIVHGHIIPLISREADYVRRGSYRNYIEQISIADGIAARLTALGGRPVFRDGVVTDNGNHILDVHDLHISDPRALESAINQLAGVVTVGLFAARPADLLIVGTDSGVRSV